MSEDFSYILSLVKSKKWDSALRLINLKLAGFCTRQDTIKFLMTRIRCYYELHKTQLIIEDCKHLLFLLNNDDSRFIGAYARYMMIWSLNNMKNYADMYTICKDWLNSLCKPSGRIKFENLLANICSYCKQKSLEKMLHIVEEISHHWSCSEFHTANQHHLEDFDQRFLPLSDIIFCETLILHIDRQKEKVAEKCNNQNLVNGLTGKETLQINDDTIQETKWKWRQPPRGFTLETYSLCDSYMTRNYCNYGSLCVEAHSITELEEWKQRYKIKKLGMEPPRNEVGEARPFTDRFLEMLSKSSCISNLAKKNIEGVEATCSQDLTVIDTSKPSEIQWIFHFTACSYLKAVSLLRNSYGEKFFISSICCESNEINGKTYKVEPNRQEWLREKPTKDNSKSAKRYRVTLGFKSEIYGIFRQSVVFDFGNVPYLIRHLCVEVVPHQSEETEEDVENLCLSEKWNANNSHIIPFTSEAYSYRLNDLKEQILLSKYPIPDDFEVTPDTLNKGIFSRENYKTKMHDLIYMEEIARTELISRYNVKCTLVLTQSYLLSPSGAASSTAKYALPGEYFALLNLSKDISEDTTAGRLILNNCLNVLIGPQNRPNDGDKITVYEALIEDKGKNVVYLRLSKEAVIGFGVANASELEAEVQFQFNRISFCEWHHAIDKMQNYDIMFPNTSWNEKVPWSPHKQWNDNAEMNPKQKEALIAITTPLDFSIPPILLIGPFGTGKTYTIAQSVKHLLLQKEPIILICTHSNSAADLYIKDYLHPWCESGLSKVRPLRIYYHKRWVVTVNTAVQQYCLINTTSGIRSFRPPKKEDIMKTRVVVVTLSTSMYLSTLNLPKGHFTHIFIDEAAQALECEALMPLALATSKTRIVLAGDHMQLSPEIVSKFSKQHHLHVSMLERLYQHYPLRFPCKILLSENYRAHEALVNFTSIFFYEKKLVAKGIQPVHGKYYPLTFFTTQGEDEQCPNSTAFYNKSEVYEIVERISELSKNWPPSWGKMDDSSIGILTPYSDQVFRIRSELRKRRLGSISVERVLNVQGKEFRAVFLSTVRTRRTCGDANGDFGFLSDQRLLNTAITRARSLVAVVGDPIALCTVGRCRKLWEQFIHICHKNNSLHGTTWTKLKLQLDGVEFKKHFVLNPLAPEFVPRSKQLMPAVPIYPYPQPIFQIPPPAKPFHVIPNPFIESKLVLPVPRVENNIPKCYYYPQNAAPITPPINFYLNRPPPNSCGNPMPNVINQFPNQFQPPPVTLNLFPIHPNISQLPPFFKNNFIPRPYKNIVPKDCNQINDSMLETQIITNGFKESEENDCNRNNIPVLPYSDVVKKSLKISDVKDVASEETSEKKPETLTVELHPEKDFTYYINNMFSDRVMQPEVENHEREISQPLYARAPYPSTSKIFPNLRTKSSL